MAVKTTGWPTTAGLADAVRAVPVAARLTTSVRAAEVLAAKSLVPIKDAVRECDPAPRATDSVAWPAALTDERPSALFPSWNVTVPAGVPAAAVTVAVSVTGWPLTTGLTAAARLVVVGAA